MTRALAVPARNLKNAMELLNNFTKIARSIVLYPSVASVLALFATSLVNELFGIVPYTIILSSQMVFLDIAVSVPLLVKIFIFIAIPVGIGTALGSLLIYGLAYLGGKPGIEKFGKRIHLSWESVERVQSKFKGSWYDEILFLALRSVPFLPGLPISAAAGILRMHVYRYLALTALGAAIKVMIMFALVGFGTEAVDI